MLLSNQVHWYPAFKQQYQLTIEYHIMQHYHMGCVLDL